MIFDYLFVELRVKTLMLFVQLNISHHFNQSNYYKNIDRSSTASPSLRTAIEIPKNEVFLCLLKIRKA